MSEDLRHPIGKFTHEGAVTEQVLQAWKKEIADAPERLRVAVEGLSDEQLDTPYRPGGWTVRQVVHHVADSHINSYMRFKLALTEEEPTIKPYFEDRWAELADGKAMPVEVSLTLLDALHRRWTALLESMTEGQFSRAFVHPETGAKISLARNTGIYAWHGNHHIAHITSLRERMGWS